MDEHPVGYVESDTLLERECVAELQAMLNAYDGSLPFLEWAQGYIQTHPSKYDFRAIVKYIHPVNEPAKKHDGNLDKYRGGQVWLSDGMVFVHETETIDLLPGQALSLLAWLREHEEELHQLARSKQ